MKSPVKPNGDLIEQFEIRAVIAADLARTNLLFGLCRRIAAGARVERGALDLQIMDLADGEGNIDFGAVLEYARSENFDCPCWLDINTTRSIADSDRSLREYRPTWT